MKYNPIRKCNFTKGELILNIDYLFTFKSVYVKNWKRVAPIAFLQNWSYLELRKWLVNNQFYTAIPKEKE